MKKDYKLIIIGAGPAGLTAGIYAARAQLEPLIIEGPYPGGQLMGTTYIENWPGEQNILGPTLMMNMRDHAQNAGCTIISETVNHVNFEHKPFLITTHKHSELSAQTIVIATGATPKKLGCPGEKQYWGKGVSTCAVCDGTFYSKKKVIVVGGGDTAAEYASFLSKITDHVTIVHILDTLTASKSMQQHILENPHITILYNSTITEIRGNNSNVTEAVITNQKTNEQIVHPVAGIFLAIGYTPNTAIFKGKLALDSFGYINIHDYTKTSIPGVFAAGDAADYRYRQAITAAGGGCMAALDAERYLINEK